jgi:hypothetical protein
MNSEDKFKQIGNVSSLPPITDAVTLEDDVDIVGTDYYVDMPIEDDVDLELEAIANQAARDKREAGYRMFIGGASLEDIAREAVVSLAVVNTWAKDGTWEERLRNNNDISEGLVQESVRRIRLSRAEEEARESINMSKQLRGAVKSRLDTDERLRDGVDDLPLDERIKVMKRQLRPMDLKNLGDAAKAGGDLGNYGMGTDKQKGDAVGNKQLVIIANGGRGGLPGIKIVDGSVSAAPGTDKLKE